MIKDKMCPKEMRYTINQLARMSTPQKNMKHKIRKNFDIFQRLKMIEVQEKYYSDAEQKRERGSLSESLNGNT